MSRKAFCDDCSGCRPVLVDGVTKVPLGSDHPAVRAILAVWEGSTLAERKAFHNVCCKNSRSPDDRRLSDALSQRMKDAVNASRGPEP
jgi:hypothetical protein